MFRSEEASARGRLFGFPVLFENRSHRIGMSTTPSPAVSGRVVSIDALRGFDMFWLMRGYGVITAAAALIGPNVGAAVAAQMDHSKWVGFTFWDFIAPLFLFVVGLSMPYSISRRLERGDSRRDLYRHIVRRTVVLILLGWLLSGWLGLEFPLRITGVLPRIALSYFIAASIVMRCGIRGQILVLGPVEPGHVAEAARAIQESAK